MSTTKPDVNDVWASLANPGDKTTPGDAKILLGWVEEDIPPHATFNFQMNKVAAFIAHINEFGIAKHDLLTDYPVSARVLGSDGNLYKSSQTPNVGQDPTTAGSFWDSDVVPLKATQAEAQAGTNNDKYVTPLNTDQFYQARKATTVETVAETDPNKFITPFTLGQAFTARVLPNSVKAPTNTVPIDAATAVVNPTLTTDPYAALYGIPQESAQFRVATNSDMSTIIHDSGEIGATTSYTVPNGVLSNSTQYYWQARYKSAEDQWSSFSLVTSFTSGVLAYILQPSITLPLNLATEVSRVPTITSSAFAVSGASDSHTSSKWEIAIDTGFLNKVYDSGFIADLVSHTIPSGILAGSVVYHVRVTYRGSTLGDSSPSTAIQFTTKLLDVDWSNYTGAQDGTAISLPDFTLGDQITATFVEYKDFLQLQGWGNANNITYFNFRKSGTDIIPLSKVVQSTSLYGPLGGFKNLNMYIASASIMRKYEPDGINYTDLTLSPVIPTSHLPLSSNYVVGNMSIYPNDNTIHVLDGNKILTYVLNEAETAVASSNTMTAGATNERKNSLKATPSTNLMVTLGGGNTSQYGLASFNTGALILPVLDSFIRTGLNNQFGTISVLAFFSENYFGVFLATSGGSINCDIYRLDADGTITQISVDNVITTGSGAIYRCEELDQGLVMLVANNPAFRYVCSYDVGTDTVSVESTVSAIPAGFTTTIQMQLLNDKDVISNCSFNGIQVLSARV
jgi:hypothetical protein